MANSQALLAGVTRLALGGRGPTRGYVFDPHRLALPCWAEATEGRPALLLTLDRHLDLVPPLAPPARGASVQALDTHARLQLDVRNVDFILAGMEAGVVSDAVVVARARPVGCVTSDSWADSTGTTHRLLVVPTIDRLSAEFGSKAATPEGKLLATWLAGSERTLLDVDLDCFTSPSDADPTTIVPWTGELIHDHVLPMGSEAFWAAALEKCVGLTFAREPGHCGGLVPSGRLFEAAARVIFGELLKTDLP